MSELNDRGIEMLSAAVIVQAVRDWCYCRSVIEAGKRETDKHRRDGEICYMPIKRLEDVERFFRGRWFCILTDINGEELIEKLRELNVRRISIDSLSTKERRQTSASWQRLGAFPELQEILWANGITQGNVCAEIGISDATLATWIKQGLTDKRLRLITGAADRIMERRRNENQAG